MVLQRLTDGVELTFSAAANFAAASGDQGSLEVQSLRLPLARLALVSRPPLVRTVTVE